MTRLRFLAQGGGPPWLKEKEFSSGMKIRSSSAFFKMHNLGSLLEP